MKGLKKLSKINVIGAGLAGCEAAWQIARRGIQVKLFDMKPKKFSPAHKSENFCELVCSNSFKAIRKDNASGLLKEELRQLGSVVLECAEQCSVPAGGALAVEREAFSSMVTRKIKGNNLIEVISSEVCDIPNDGISIIATGPLTSEALSASISKLCGGALSFFDAAAPIISAESIDMNNAFFASRYDKGEGSSYINCPMTEDEYREFHKELIKAERAPVHGFDISSPKVYEGCMPVEVAAARGFDTLRYGTMKPVGLRDPRTGSRPFAVVQLRREDAAGRLFNMVGFQTNLKFGEQKKVFSMIPALRDIEIVRYGVMHRNFFINSPNLLNASYSMRQNPNLFFAGQITGVEGYMESVSSGMIAGINAARKFSGEQTLSFPLETMIGSLASYISNSSTPDFQPMGANFGIIAPLGHVVRDKKQRCNELSECSIKILKETVVCENNS